MLYWPLEAVVVALSLGLAVWQRSGDREHRTPACLWLLVGWVVMIFVTNVASGSGHGVEQATAYLKRVAIYYFFFLALDSTRRLRGALLWIVLLSAVLGLQAISMVRNGVGWAGQPMYWGGRVAWIGLWNGANILSLLFVTAVPFALEMVLGVRSLGARLLGAASTALILAGMFLANSRGGYLALGVAMMVYFRERIGWKGLALGAPLVLVLFSFGPSRLADINMEEDSARTRVDMWAEGLDMLKANPLLGVGKGEFVVHSGQLVAHNVIVQNFSETGFLGFFFWLGAVYWSLKALVTVVRRRKALSPELASASSALLASVCGFFAASMFINTDLEPLYVLLALCAVIADMARREGAIDALPGFGGADLARVVALEVVLMLGMYAVTALISAVA
jgi:O-antigen ligase